MWILFAFGSAFFAGITSVLAKCGIKQTDSNLATATRTVVVLVMAFLMTLVVGSLNTISSITAKSWIFLVLSGLSTGASWLCYFKALQNGDINKVVPVDKSSTVIAMLMAFVFLHEKLTWIKALCMAAVAAGTYLMIEKKDVLQKDNKRVWLFYAVLSALFAAATSIFGQNRNRRRGIQPWNLYPYVCCACHGVVGCFSYTQREKYKIRAFKGTDFHTAFRSCNGSVLAVLFQGA